MATPIQTPDGPSVRTQHSQRAVPQFNVSQTLDDVSTLSRALGSFFGVAGNVAQEAADRHQAVLDDDLVQKGIREGQERQEPSPEVSANRNALAAHIKTKAQVHAIDAVRDVYENVISRYQYGKDTVSLEERIEEYKKVQFKGLPESDLYRNNFFATFEEGVGRHFQNGVLKQQEQLQRNFVEDWQTVTRDLPPTTENFNRQIDSIMATDVDGSITRGVAASRIMQVWQEKAMTGTRQDLDRYTTFIDEGVIDEQGRSFAQLYPQRALEMKAEALDKWKQDLTYEDKQATAALRNQISSASAQVGSGRWREVDEAALIESFHAYDDNHGGGERVQGELVQVLMDLGAAKQLSEKIDTAFSGDMVFFNEDEAGKLDRAIMHQIGEYGLLLDPDAPDLDQRVAALGRVLANTHKATGGLPKSLSTQLAAWANNKSSPRQQSAAFRALYEMDRHQPGSAAAILEGNPTAATNYQALVDSGAFDHGTLDERLHNYNAEYGNVMRDVQSKKLHELFGEDQDDTDKIMRSIRSTAAKTIAAELGADETLGPDWGQKAYIAPGSTEEKWLVQLVQEQVAQARLDGQGSTNDYAGMAERAAKIMAASVAVDPKGVGSTTALDLQAKRNIPAKLWGGFLDVIGYGDERANYRIVRKDSARPHEKLGGTADAGMNWRNPVSGRVEFPAIETMPADIAALGEKAGLQLEARAGKYTKNNAYDVYVKRDDVNLPFLMNRDGTYDFAGQQIEMTGDPVKDTEAIQAAAKAVGLPQESFGLVPVPGSRQYQLVAFPRASTPMPTKEERLAQTRADLERRLSDSVRKARAAAAVQGKVAPSVGVTKADLKFGSDALTQLRNDRRSHPSVKEDPAYKKLVFDEIAASESRRAFTYKDHKGKRTVGYGFNLDAPGHMELAQRTLQFSDAQMSLLLNGKMALSERQMQRLFDVARVDAESVIDSRLKGVPLTRSQRAALVSLAYNAKSLIGDNLVTAIKEGRWEDAMNEILHNSNREAHKGLARRRFKEAALFARGNQQLAALLPDPKKYLSSFN